MVKKYFIFIIGGGLGALLTLSLTYLLTEIGGFYYLASYVIASAANLVFIFFYQRHITFAMKDLAGKRFLKSISTSLLIGVFTIGLIYLLTNRFGVWYMLSATISITLMSVFNFSINNFWVFSKNEEITEQN